jgi:adenine/guanine phosphoribosyltransferase-like PRPP-binding protein
MNYCQISSHLEDVLHPKLRQDTIRWLFSELYCNRRNFSAIVVCGVSGLVVGPVLADKLEKNLIVVRQHGTMGTHGAYVVEGPRDDSYVFIDDLINEGKTLRHVKSSIRRFCRYSKMVGVVLYHKQQTYWKPQKQLKKFLDPNHVDDIKF